MSTSDGLRAALVAFLAGGGVSGALAYRVAGRDARTSASKSVIDGARTVTETSLALLEPVRHAAAESERRAIVFQGQAQQLEAIIVSLSGSLSKQQVQLDQLREQLALRDTELGRYRGVGGPPC